MSKNETEKTVVVTGFGPFGEHKVNASWETVKHLQTFNLKEVGVNLIAEEIPVVYDAVLSKVPDIWKQHNPDLVVHVGVSRLAQNITLETIAHNTGYSKPDTRGKLPELGCCIVEEQQNECITTELDVERICSEVNKATGNTTSAVTSKDAGRFLCEFTFYESLFIDRSRVVFIHVPEINKPYSIEEMASCLKQIILLLLDQLSEQERKQSVNS